MRNASSRRTARAVTVVAERADGVPWPAVSQYAGVVTFGTMNHMIEFLIRTRGDGGWPAIHRDRMPQVLTPAGWDCAGVPGWGDYRLRCGDTEISFSGEPIGWEVSVEGPMPADVATKLVVAVAAQIEREVNQAVEWIQVEA